jgi:ppGpp synthetase/RelA/SpoT-type nucleotidyltranferase
MTDLCGMRVILLTTDQVADYCELIKKYFEVDWEHSEDAGARLGDAEFGYTSQHFVVSFLV